VSLSAQIEAVNADPSLNEDQKRKERYRIKCDGLASALQPYVGQTYLYEGVNWTLLHASSFEEAGEKYLRLVARGVRASDGVRILSPKDELIFVNPPILDKTGVENLLQTAREIIARTVG
jgi:hypothetical protein